MADFTKGVEPALRSLGKLFNKEDRAETEIEKYNKLMKRALKEIQTVPKGLKIAVLSGVYQGFSGKTFVRAELPGGYTDKYILSDGYR